MSTPELIRDPAEWQLRLTDARDGGARIALVPTMGYLHEGHLSLMREARHRADSGARRGLSVATIFVNPTQFGPSEDLARYPRDLEGDLAKCGSAGVDMVLAPEDPKAMYLPGFQTWVDVEEVSKGLCGDRRPGHFRGVATVVAKLLGLSRPHVALFGDKDWQQLQVIRRMVLDLDMGVEVVGMPIVREPDGLALSSRNAYLSARRARPRAGHLAGARGRPGPGRRRGAGSPRAGRGNRPRRRGGRDEGRLRRAGPPRDPAAGGAGRAGHARAGGRLPGAHPAHRQPGPAVKKARGQAADDGVKVVAQNRRARFDYDIEERFEAGLSLTGSEVKSLRESNVAISDAYAALRGDELWLLNCRIGEYAAAAAFGHAPLRERKLLLRRAEIEKLRGKVEQRGYTLVPISIYFKEGWAKVELGLGRGKTHEDRRDHIAERESRREMDRALSRKRR